MRTCQGGRRRDRTDRNPRESRSAKARDDTPEAHPPVRPPSGDQPGQRRLWFEPELAPADGPSRERSRAMTSITSPFLPPSGILAAAHQPWLAAWAAAVVGGLAAVLAGPAGIDPAVGFRR